MKNIFLLLLFIILNSTCKNVDPKPDSKHLFYLHGRIIEIQGVHAVSEKYGAYQYNEIIKALEKTGAIIHNEIRTSDTDFYDFSKKISDQIDSLIATGTKPQNISVIGASKGAVMTMNISNQNTKPINYILLAANNDYIEQENDWHLHGKILGIYEASDQAAGKNYQYWIDQSPEAIQFKELKVNTGLGHGFLYQPLEEWLVPAFQWAGLNQNKSK